VYIIVLITCNSDGIIVSAPCFSWLSRKRWFVRKQCSGHETCVLFSSTAFVWKFSFLEEL